MALLDVYNYPIGRSDIFEVGTSFSTVVVNVSNNGAAAIFTAKAGTITKIGIYTSAVTTPPVCQLSLEGVSANAPDGTIKNSTNAFVTFTPAVGWSWQTIGSSGLVCTGNEILAAVLRYSSGTVDGSHNATFAVRTATPPNVGAFYAATLSAGTWSTVQQPPSIAVQYSDGSVLSGMFGLSALANDTTWNNTTTSTLYKGVAFAPQVRCRMSGAMVGLRPASTSTYNIKLFDASNNILSSGVLTPGQNWSGVAAALPGFIPFSAPQILTAGSTYRLVMEASSANNPTTFPKYTFPDVNLKRAIFADLSSTVGSSAFSWTDSTTDNFYNVMPVLDQIDSGGVIVVDDD